MYIGNAFISQYIQMSIFPKIIMGVCIWLFAIIMINKYAPADTENVPVISKKERKKRKIVSYIIATIMIIAGEFVQNQIISNILIFGVLFQTITITRIAYKLTKNKYGYEEYWKQQNIANGV